MQRDDVDKMQWGQRVAMLIASVIADDNKPVGTTVALVRLGLVMAKLGTGRGSESRARITAGVRAAVDAFEEESTSPVQDEQRLVH